jgi:hypothetical protein
MKKIILLVVLNVSYWGFSQQKMIDKAGTITFEASVPSFEEVRAVNKSVTFVLNTKTGEIASLALMKGFRFKIALMEEHFNENYMETDDYPKAIFKGKIEGFDANSLTTNFNDYPIKGNLELHGKSNPVAFTAKIRKIPNGIQIVSSFSVNASDFNITIPSLVKSKIANTVTIQSTTFLK